MTFIIDILKSNPIFLLFLVAGIGYPLGRIRFGGASLGVSAVLFVGLAFGALDPDIKLPEIVYTLGLVLFVYTIGLSSGSAFFASLRKKGVTYNLLIIASLLLAAALTIIAHYLFHFKATLTAGMFAGSLTNTPALAGILEYIRSAFPASLLDQIQSEPVVAYSITYPIGVLGMILAIYLTQRLWKVDYAAEARESTELGGSREPLENRTILVQTSPELTIKELVQRHQWNAIFGRYRRDSQNGLVTGQTILQNGDKVNVIAPIDTIEEVAKMLGQICPDHLEFDLSQYNKQRIFVSNPEIAGRKLKDLDLFNRFGATITRLRRGDIEMLPHGNTRLSLGDQVRAVGPHPQLQELARLLGDSYRGISEIDILSFSLGLALGLLLGMIPIPLPGGSVMKLGIAGGPLMISLVLGALGRTGPLIWQLPYSANLTLRQIGLILFLAGVGTRSGYAFFSTFSQGDGLYLFIAGGIITCAVALFTLWVGYRWLGIPMGLLTGILAGLQTQPAVLGFSLEQSQNELPNIGYATVYPVAMVTKILLAQLILILLR